MVTTVPLLLLAAAMIALLLSYVISIQLPGAAGMTSAIRKRTARPSFLYVTHFLQGVSPRCWASAQVISCPFYGAGGVIVIALSAGRGIYMSAFGGFLRFGDFLLRGLIGRRCDALRELSPPAPVCAV